MSRARDNPRVRRAFRSSPALLFLAMLFSHGACHAQELAPRAYVITPIHGNALILTYSFYDGSLEFDGSIPVTGANARVQVPMLSYYHSFGLAGHSANITFSLPYAVGHFHGAVAGAERNAYRSGLLDSAVRFAVNLKGGPAMTARQFQTWRQGTLLGVSLTLVVPTGQYDPTKLLNYGANRWAVKPEFGYSRRFGHWVLDAYGAAWFFTENPEYFSRNAFFPGTRNRTENPVGAFEGHLSYTVRPRFWVSLDGNFWFGGRTSLNGVPEPATLQKNSRVGLTAAIPVTSHQTLKFSYSNGAYIRYGGDFQKLAIAWQYSWFSSPTSSPASAHRYR